MAAPERNAQYYFAATRFIAHLRGRSACRSEKNWVEANIVGAAVFSVSYAAVGRVLLGDASVGRQLLFAIPVAIATWLFWLVALYVNLLAIKLLRAGGFLRDLSDARAQSLLIGLTTTLFACWLATAPSWVSFLGFTWLGGVFLNLTAAALLAFSDGSRART
jgi:hypothetical protein